MSQIQAGDGAIWDISVASGPRVEWRPWHIWRHKSDVALPEPSGSEDKPAEKPRWYDWLELIELADPTFWIGIGVMLILGFLGWIVLPLLLIAVNFVVIIAGTFALITWRMGSRSGWEVIAKDQEGVERRWRAPGWLAAHRTKKTVAAALQIGSPVVTPDAEEIIVPQSGPSVSPDD